MVLYSYNSFDLSNNFEQNGKAELHKYVVIRQFLTNIISSRG